MTSFRRFPVAFGIMLLFVVPALLAACSGEPKTSSTYGKTLELHVQQPEIVDKVAFQDGAGQHRVIRPRASNRQLAVINVTVVNRTSTVIPLLVDPEAAQLGDRRGERINALDPFERSVIVTTADVDEGKYVPLLWGEVELQRNFEVSGWMIFDVPKGLTLGSVWWNEVDDMVADYVEYFRR